MQRVKRLDAAYLQQLVRALSGGEAVPVVLRNECHLLMMAIDGNQLALIEERVRRIQQLAKQERFQLPVQTARSGE